MAISQERSKRKSTGGRYKRTVKKSKNRGNLPTLTKLAPKKLKPIRTRGGFKKIRLLGINIVNAYNPKIKKHEKLKIETVVDSKANKNYIRRNIITKGSIVKTSQGNVKITSRPGQEPILDGVLV